VGQSLRTGRDDLHVGRCARPSLAAAAHRVGTVVNFRLLALYPRGWRERYGQELTSLAQELIDAGETTRLRATFDLLAGAAAEWRRALTRPAVLVPAAVATACGTVGVAVGDSLPGAGSAKPYFDTHPAGVLLLAAALAWYLMEAAEFVRGRSSAHWRDATARTPADRGWRLAFAACVIIMTAMLYLAPRLIPAAAIRPGGTAFAAGLVIAVTGLALRWWSFRALRGRYFNYAVKVSPAQPVVTAGPYRLLRHPGHAGQLLFCIGIGLAAANWAGLAAMTVLPLGLIVWRIRIEETALVTALGERYRRYASGRKRLVPLVW
jgi:protein-S-isoprenylcysteine O-methyltransferase Ste14